jgi:DNA (cytosine-5)-methyltransferase 1
MRGLIIDSFAGGGGASTGIEWALGRSPDVAINHSAAAIAMHTVNHPRTRHYIEDVWRVDPRAATDGRPVELAWFSPDCTSFSRSKSGRPRSKRIRALAWVVVEWAKAVRPSCLALENVREFASWGPLLDDGTPCPARRGLTFRRWWRQLENLGYQLDARELRACDYGAPTTRARLFILGRRDGQPIVWPTPSHGPGRLPFVGVDTCIDWGTPAPSVFTRRRPLAPATMDRLADGLQRYVFASLTPYRTPLGGVVLGFIAKHYTGVVGSDLRDPLGTITAIDHHALVTARLTPISAEREHEAVCRAWVRDRFGRRATVKMGGVEYGVADLGHRMLTARELFAAQGFPKSVQLLGTVATQIRLCGNSVSPPVAAAVISANVRNQVQPQELAA